MTLPSGSRLGTYEIVDLLGVGGMGEVYRARDRKLGREVAIKVLPEEYSKDSDLVARFEREARMLAAVNHPTIAAIYGAEQDGPTRYIVMELVEGDTLAQRLTSGPLAIPDALRIASQIAEAREIAHEKGVIHRDLKPANIKITPEGKVKVLDFGLAKAMEMPFAGDVSKSPTLVMSDSQPGQILGTPEFMSPEQARGKDTDRRTDIWAFGCILFEALSGKRAFTGETVPDVVGAILHVEPDWAKLPARAPERVRELLRLCLEKDPGRRLRDAGDARLELEAALAGMSGAGSLAATGKRARWKTVAAVAAGAALAIAAYFLVRPKESPSYGASAIRQLAVLPFRNLTSTAEGDLMGFALADYVSASLDGVPGLRVITPSVEASNQDTDMRRVALKLGANTLLSGSLQSENGRFRITYRLLDGGGSQIAANTIDGTSLFGIQDRLTDGVIRDLRLRRRARRTPTPSGLDSLADQERYLQAIGLLQRQDKGDSVERAVRILTKLADEKPDSAIVQAALGRASLAMFALTRDRSWAERAFAVTDAARALDPTLPEVDITLGQTLTATGRASDAVEAFRRALAASPDKVEALMELGWALEATGDPAGAEAALKRAVELRPSWATYNRLGALYARRSLWGKAADEFRRAAAVAPDSPWAWSNLGGVLVESCKFPAALETLRKAVAILPGDPSLSSNLGLAQLWTNHTSEAVATLERAAAAAPKDCQIQGNLGDAYRVAGSSAKAAEAYSRSIALAHEELRINPRSAEAFSFLAMGLARTGKVAEASGPMQEALALQGKNPNVLADAATVAALGHRDAEALDWLRKAVSAGYCRDIILWQPELARFRDNSEFRSIVTAPRNAAGS